MSQSTRVSVARQLDYLRSRCAQRPGRAFSNLLPDDTPTLLGTPDDPIYTPLITLAMFLGQVLDTDGSCQHAVTQFLAWRAATGQEPCGAGTGAYCKARQRLPEEGLRTLARRTGAALSSGAPEEGRWNGRRVRIVDGSTVTAADTPANQKEYPQPESQKPGLGFPMIRLVVLFCLATGAVLDAALAPYHGKGTGELSLLRSLWHQLDTGDVLVGDRLYCSYFEIALLNRRGVDVAVHKHQSRRTDFRTGRRLGRNDHVIAWPKPARPDWMDEGTYAVLPATLSVREVRVTVACPGFRVQRYELITTLLSPDEFSVAELGALYRRRWEAELDLRALKRSLGMDQLRGKSPAMVRKELWVYLLGYNVVRGMIAEAAGVAGVAPQSLSFTGARQALVAFAPVLVWGPDPGHEDHWRRMWGAVGTRRVGNRPGRVEPRAIKRRKNNYPTLNEPRKLAQQRLLGTP